MTRKGWPRAVVVALVSVSLASGLAVGLGPGLGTPAAGAAEAGANGFVKYYVVVAQYQGKPENLTEIATRFLKDPGRTLDLFSLNAGRKQADGGALSDPWVLKPGWTIVLPWDAAGDGVLYGDPGGDVPSAQPGLPSAPAPSTPAPPGGDAQCFQSSGDSGSDWAQRALALDQAWARTRGAGVMVAVVDSGIDATVPQLAGRVAAGADITAGSGRGDVDCLGSGTAMAGIITARAAQDGPATGVAPDATVLPIRVVTTGSAARATDVATAIEVSLSAGSSVIALGSYVDINQPEVANAIASALSHNVVVVVGAQTDAVPASVGPGPGMIRVGGAGEDRQLAAIYRSGGVDVVAPGIDISSVGPGKAGLRANSGTQYAVAFVAATAALVRSAHPELTAVEVVHRIEVTSQAWDKNLPDAGTGWGMIRPAEAVTATVPDEARVDGLAEPGQSGSVIVGWVTLIVVVGAAVTVALVRARRVRTGSPQT